MTATLDVYLLSRFHDERSLRIAGFCRRIFAEVVGGFERGFERGFFVRGCCGGF